MTRLFNELTTNTTVRVMFGYTTCDDTFTKDFDTMEEFNEEMEWLWTPMMKIIGCEVVSK